MTSLKKYFNFSYIYNDLFFKHLNWKQFTLLFIIIRLIFFISDGHNSDFDFFEHWGDRIIHEGFTNIYSIKVDRFECDYPPLYLYIIAPLAYLFDAMQWDLHTHFYDNFLKAFNLIVEFIFLYFFYKKTNNKVFLFVMLLSPVSILNAYAWGQIDILYTILIFSSFYLLFKSELYLAAVLIGLSLSLKTQTILFLPFLFLLYLFNKSNLQTKILSLLLLIVIYLIPNLPFILYAPNPMDSINPHITAAGRYNNISVNAFNFYWVLWADFDIKMDLKFPSNDALVFQLITRKMLAYSLFFICFSWIVFQFTKNISNEKKIIALLSFYCFSFFMLLPEMHERYLFPMFFFSAYLISFDKKEWPYFLIITILHACNLIWGWAENKFIKVQWLFEISRIFALAITITYVFYLRRIVSLIKSKE